MFDRSYGFSEEAGKERLRQQAELSKDPAKRKEAWTGESTESPKKPVVEVSAPKDDWDDPWAEFDSGDDKDAGQWVSKKDKAA